MNEQANQKKDAEQIAPTADSISDSAPGLIYEQRDLAS